MADEALASEPVLFRPSKKRKTYRARPNTEDDDTEQHQQQQTQPESRPDPRSGSDEGMSEDGGVAAALRARNARRKLHGVNFQSSGPRDTDTLVGVGVAHPGEPDARQVAGISNRFTHQTGLVKDLDDRHLNEFIASRLSGRTVAPTSQGEPSLDSTVDAKPAARAPQGVKHGKLEEVAIPEPTKPQAQSQMAPAPRKVRLGPDGKPWRGRKRRGSDDVKRDQLVEEFLRENRLDVYEVPKTDNAASEADGAADERLAQEFRQQYLDDVAKRQHQQKKKKVQTAGAATEDVLRGPKLGGSRNTRAQVRDQLLKEKAQGKK